MNIVSKREKIDDDGEKLAGLVLLVDCLFVCLIPEYTNYEVTMTTLF